MKKITIACFISMLLISIAVSSKAYDIYIPDANFKQALIDLNLDSNNSGQISQAEARALTGTLDVSSKNIADLTGIEHFVNITGLNCSNNILTSLDVGAIVSLETLNYSNNKFPFSALQQIKEDFDAITYTSNTSIFSQQEEGLGFEVDYSAEVNIDGNTTAFVWYDTAGNAVGTSYVEEQAPGVFKFLQLGTYYCKMTNASFTNLELQTETITINSSILYIPDANFKQALIDKGVDSDGDNKISQTEAAAVTRELNVTSKDITDLTGIEYFINLERLDCQYNNLTSLDLNSNTKLGQLYCHNNQLSSLIINNLKKLEFLECNDNLLSKLDIDAFVAEEKLWEFHCNNNKFPFSALESIDHNLWINLASTYTSDLTIFTPQKDAIGFEVDYSTEVNINGNTTKFVWYDTAGNAVGESYVEEQESGVFKFLQSGTYYCKMTNASFTNLELQTETITIDQVLHIPDANFKQALIDKDVDSNGDNEISEMEAAALTGTLDVNSKSIADLTGITYFTGITELDCSNNILTNLDVSANTALTTLNCNGNRFPFSVLQQIKEGFAGANFSYTSDTSIFSQQEEGLGFEADYSAEVNIGGNTTTFVWYDTDGNAVDESYVEEQESGVFKFLQPGTYHCKMTNASFTNLELQTETITIGQVLYIPDTNFKQALIDLNVDSDKDNEISPTEAAAFTETLPLYSKNIADLTGIEYFVNITKLDCDYNKLTDLDVSKNTALIELDCEYNNLTDLDVSKNTALTYLNCSDNNLNNLDVSENTALKNLYCGVNNLSSLDVSNNKALEHLSCNENNLSSLDVSENTALKEFNCGINNLSSLDVNIHTALEDLRCNNNNLTDLDVSKNTVLKVLYCNNNILTDLDVSHQDTALLYLICSENSLTNLDVSKNTKLVDLRCNQNNLSSLDVSVNTALLTLECNQINLNSLDVSENTELTHLSCNKNNLSSLDLSENNELMYLSCNENSLTNLDISNILLAYGFSCNDNKFPFSVLQQIKDHYNSLTYTSDSTIFSVQEKALGYEENYSAEVNIGGNTTTFVWYDNDGNTVGASYVEEQASGVFKFLQLGTYYCKMTNASFTNLELQTETITIKKAQNISFNPATEAKVNDVVELEATADSGLDVNFELISGNATLNGSSLTFNEAGTVTIRAYHNGNDEYVAEEQTATITVSKKAQNISFNPATEAKVNDVVELEATADSGLDVNFELISGNATLNGSSLTFNEAGTVTIRAYSGNDEYVAAEQIATITVSKKEQSIIFTPATEAKVNDMVELEATADSGLDVNFELISGNATLNGSSLTFNEAGTVTIRAYHNGNNEYVAAEQTTTITVSKKEQSISFNPATEAKVNDVLELTATATSNLPVSFEVVTGNASLNGNSVTFNEAGTVTIKAVQDGDDEYAAAEQTATITVSKKEQSISVADDLPTEFEVNDDLDLSSYISASSGLDVSFEVVTDNASLNGNAITFTGAGTVTVKASQEGNDEYDAAVEQTVEFTVSVPTSIGDDELSKTSVSIYPNPVVDEVNIRFKNGKRKTITLFNPKGEKLMETEAYGTKTMNLSNLPSGIYILKIQSEDQAVSFKIIKN